MLSFEGAIYKLFFFNKQVQPLLYLIINKNQHQMTESILQKNEYQFLNYFIGYLKCKNSVNHLVNNLIDAFTSNHVYIK
jgi:hypothetical protein